MKKLRICMLAVLIISLFSFTKVLAAGADVGVSADKSTAKPGETITVTVSASCEEGLAYIGTLIEYDTNKLTLKNINVGSNWVNYGINDRIELLVNSTSEIKSDDVCTLIFEVKEEAEEGDAIISLKEIEISDILSNEYTKEDIQKTVTISKEQAPDPTDDPEPEPSDDPTVDPTDDPTDKPSDKPSDKGTEPEKKSTDDKTKDDTAKKSLPDTGNKNSIIISVFVITAIAAGSYIGYKKYKEIN